MEIHFHRKFVRYQIHHSIHDVLVNHHDQLLQSQRRDEVYLFHMKSMHLQSIDLHQQLLVQ